MLLVMAIIGLWNLDRLPIAWNDEVQNLDPALVWHNTGIFCSPLWPNPGADIKFLSYPPLIEAWHCLWLFFGKSVWIVRLPFLIAHLLTGLLLYRGLLSLLKNQENHTFWAFFLTALFLFDKSTGEIARSLRVETPILLLLALVLPLLNQYFTQQTTRGAVIIGTLLGCLTLAHLYTWPLVATALILAVLAAKTNKQNMKSLLMVLTFSLPIGIFWAMLSPEIHDLKSQLLMQTADHSSHAIKENLIQFFWGRFFPYTLEQPYTPVFHALYFVLSFQLLHFYKTSFSHTATALTKAWIPFIYLSLSLPMMLLLAPQHRYYPIQHFLGLLVVADAIVCLGIHKKIERIGSAFYNTLGPYKRLFSGISTAIVVGMILFPYTIRHSAAAWHRTQRNPNTAIAFLNKNLNPVPAGEILGEPIADYWLAQSPNKKHWRFGFEFYPQHFPYSPQVPRYFLSRVSPNQLPFLSIVDSLQIPATPWQQKLSLPAVGHTYNGLYLYRISSRAGWDSLIQPAMLRVTSGH